MISTRGRYALRIMIYLVEHGKNRNVSIKEIAKHQNLSEKYLEGIVRILVKGNFLKSEKGRSGGYRLKKASNQYTVLDILSLTEVTLAPVACLSCSINECKSANMCKTLPMWKQFDALVNNFFDDITLEDLCNGQLEKSKNEIN